MNKNEQIEFEMKVMDDTDTYVFKSHNLIESGYNFSLNEQRLTYLASKKLKPKYVKSNIKPSQLNSYIANETFREIKIYVNEFKEEFGLNSNNLYSVLKDTAEKLYNKDIQYLQEDGTYTKKRWVITSKYNDEGKYVIVTFHPDLILDLLVIKGRYGKMNYNSIKQFNTSYAFRIYELLQNYAYKGIRSFDLEDLRYKLGIYDDNKYKQFSDFKKYVIEKSINVINKSTNLNVSYAPKKHGRKVGKIEFNISQKTHSKDLIENNEYDKDIIDESQIEKMQNIIGCELTAGTVAKITDITIDSIRKYNIDMGFYEYIQYEMDIVNEYAKNKEINVIACLRTAISEYWTKNKAYTNSFNNFKHREIYDDEVAMSELEKKLLGWDNDD